MGAFYTMLKFCEANPCPGQPSATFVLSALDAEYPRVPLLFTCPAGEPPKPASAVSAALVRDLEQQRGQPLEAEAAEDVSRYTSERFTTASEAWVFRTNFCAGLPLPEPDGPRDPNDVPPDPDPRPDPDDPTRDPERKPKVAGGGIGLVAVAIGLGLFVLNRTGAS